MRLGGTAKREKSETCHLWRIKFEREKEKNFFVLGVCHMMEDTGEQGVSLLRGAQDQPRRIGVSQSR